MGVSTDGILVYGIAFEEEEVPDFLEPFDGDFDDYLGSISGLPQYGEPGHSFDDHRKFRDACPVDVVTHCSYDYPMYIIAVRGTELRNKRGYVAEVESLAVDEEKFAAFKAWCADRSIEGEPKWLLCSMWG